ncbi:hypothetical protein SAMD00023353_14600010 [Rosellinia necatrix]|uniref:Uncharacterized protein n=1 Tax=Rosellinia necatrix TaxID=77044 RepID=A0A1W2TAL2_ROSNE|nr:hypothetical protein SAMD00023353_14600010 [Rosellinia necatrix]
MAPDIELTDLPSLESLAEYGVTQEIEANLLAKEAARLVEAVTSNTPLEFIGSQDLTLDTASSYEILASLADQIWHALHIDKYDADNIIIENCPRLKFGADLANSRTILENFCGEDNDVTSRQSMTPERRQDYFSLVDYCTGIIARVVCGAAEGKPLHVNLLAYLAKVSTKLKVLSANLIGFAELSLQNNTSDSEFDHQGYSNLRGRHDQIDKHPDTDPSENSSLARLFLQQMRMKPEESEAATREAAVRMAYFIQGLKYRISIHSILRVILLSLKGTNKLYNSPLLSFEMCSIVYESGFEGKPILVFQDGNDGLLGTSDASNLNCALSGFNVLHKAIRHVQPQVDPPSSQGESGASVADGSSSSPSGVESDSKPKSVGTQIQWNYQPSGRDIGNTSQTVTRLTSMSRVITVIIPFLMTDPRTVNCVQRFIDLAVYTEFDSERLSNPVIPREFGKYTAFFCLSTADYQRKQESLKPFQSKSLSSAVMRCNGLYTSFAPGRFFSSTSSTSSTSSDDRMVQVIQHNRAELNNIAQIVDDWVFEEKGVMVQCTKYVLACILGALLLAVGGLAVGASLGQRISGVDPFNITTYSWVLAAFLLLVAKSVRVENWSWNDFLHGRVLCKSVSELSSVTGIDEQFIFVKLLQDERESFLETRGPYNTVFRRKSDDGFSIDKPLKIWAMLISGLIMIETKSIRGQSLVCLDLRIGTEFQLLDKVGDSELVQDRKYIHSARALDSKEEGKDVNGTRIRLTEGKVSWLRTIGLYVNEDAKFV